MKYRNVSKEVLKSKQKINYLWRGYLAPLMIASDNHGQIWRRRETENRTRDRPVATPPPNLILFSNRGAVTTSAFVFFSSKPREEAAA